MEFQCRVIVPRRCTSCCSSVENIPLQAERHSARRQELFAFPPESAFTFRPECCSESQRNRVRLHSGIAFTFDRIPQKGQDIPGPAQLATYMKHKQRREGWLVFFDARKPNASRAVPSIFKRAPGTIRTLLIEINPVPPSKRTEALSLWGPRR